MPPDIRPLQSIVHLAIDLGTDYVSGLDYFNPEYARKLPSSIDAFSAALHGLGLITIWVARADNDLYCRPATPENIPLIAPGRELLTTPNPNDWISLKKSSDALSNPELRARLVEWDTQCVILTGFSIEACIAETAMHLLEMGITCLVPVDLVAAYTGKAPYGSAQFREWNQTAIAHIMETANSNFRARSNIALTSSQEILALLQKSKGPAPQEPALKNLRQAG